MHSTFVTGYAQQGGILTKVNTVGIIRSELQSVVYLYKPICASDVQYTHSYVSVCMHLRMCTHCDICDQVCKNQPCQRTKITTYFRLYCIITHVLVMENEIYTTHAEIHGESYKAYKIKISTVEQEILLNI